MSRITLATAAPARQDVWGPAIAGYLYLGGLGAGSSIVAVILDWLGFTLQPGFVTLVAGRPWEWSTAFLQWGPLAAAIGASLLVLHLGRNWARFVTACRNPRSSWLARGFLILSAYLAFGFALNAIGISAPHWPTEELVVWRFLQGVVLVLAFLTAIYTGLLLRSAKYIPAWNTSLLPILFLVSALSTGSMAVVLGALGYRFFQMQSSTAAVIEAVEVIELLIIPIEATLLGFYARHLKRGEPEAGLSARMLLAGTWRYPFWIGIVGGGLFVPFFLHLVNLGVHSEIVSILAAALVLVAGFLLRLGILAIGIKKLPPLQKLSEWRASAATLND